MSNAHINRPLWLLACQPKNIPMAIGLAILWCLGKIPFPYNVRLGKAMGQMLYLLPSRRRKITEKNLSLCFPNLSLEERNKLCGQVFENYAAGLIETSMAWWASKESLHARVEIKGLDILRAAQSQGKGVLLLGAHFSTLDMGNALGNKYFSYSCVYRPQKNTLFNAVMERGRSRHTLANIKNSELRLTVRTIRQGGVVWFGPDQDMGEEHSVYAKFFGHTAATITTTAKLAKLTKAPVLLYGQYRNKDDSGYTLRITGPLENYPSGDEAQDANAVNKLIEAAIRLEPSQYYWLHRRFKSQPNQERGAIYKS